jgi:hypothetical protein
VDYTRITSIDRTNQEHSYFLDAFINSVLSSKQLLQAQTSLDVRHMMGAYIGSMFSQSIIQAALRERTNANFAGFKFPRTHLQGNNLRASRICMLASAHNMVKCGIITCSKLQLNQLRDGEQVRNVVLALYLTHLKMLEALQDQYTFLGTENDTDAAMNARMQAMRNFCMDLDAICTNTFRVAGRFQAGRGTANLAARQALVKGLL